MSRTCIRLPKVTTLFQDVSASMITMIIIRPKINASLHAAEWKKAPHDRRVRLYIVWSLRFTTRQISIPFQANDISSVMPPSIMFSRFNFEDFLSSSLTVDFSPKPCLTSFSCCTSSRALAVSPSRMELKISSSS